MPTINPYLNFQGNTEEAFLFYQSVLGGEFIGGISRYKDMPDGANMSHEDQEKVSHIALPIGKHNVMMGTDSLESQGQTLVVGNNHFLSISTESKEEADRIFAGTICWRGSYHALRKHLLGSVFWDVQRQIRNTMDGEL